MMAEDTLDFREPYKDAVAQIIEDPILDNLSDDDGLYTPANEYSTEQEHLPYNYKLRAVKYWQSGKKKNLSIKSVQNKFKKVKSIRQLQRWARALNTGGTHRDKVVKICDFTLQNFKEAINAGRIVRDQDLRKWALQAKKELGLKDFGFKASKHWISRFKKAHGIEFRKLNKIITKTTVENDDDLIIEQAKDSLIDVKHFAQKIGMQNVYNSQRIEFQFEIHSGRILAVESEKQIDSAAHRFTIQPVISGDGHLSPLFIVLEELSGQLEPTVQYNLFKPENVYIEVSKTGKITSDNFKIWLRKVFLPNTLLSEGSKNLLLLDSWSGAYLKIVKVASRSKKLPVATTGTIQPLDIYGFQIWKNFVHHLSDISILMNYDMNLNMINNIIKIQSLIHNQLSSPRYTNLFKQLWYKSGYIDEKPEGFENPIDFGYEDFCKNHCATPYCRNIAIIRCAWCKKWLCFKNFFEDFHYCLTFEK